MNEKRKVLIMIFKLTSVLLICSISLFSTEIGDIHNQLKSCSNYNKDNDMQQGIFNWIKSVDNIRGCDMKQINFIMSNKNRLTVKSNLSLLKSQYEFCDGIENLGDAFNQRESKLKNMRKRCDKNSIDYIQKIKKLNNRYQKEKQRLSSLQIKKEKVEKILKIKNKESSKLENEIDKLENRIKKIESALREFEQ